MPGAQEKDLNPDTFIGLSFPLRRDTASDFKLTKPENIFSKKRMKFVACSRAKKTLWLLKSSAKLTFTGKEDVQ